MEKGGRNAAVVGMFDGVHLGHRHLVAQLRREAEERGLRPLVFTFPRHPLEVVNPSVAPKLLSEPEEKLRLFGNLGFTTSQIEFLLFDDAMRALTAREFIAMLRDRYDVGMILRGFNNRFGTERHLSAGDYRLIGQEEGVEIVDATPLCLGDCTPSSSEIRRLLRDGEIDSANRMLDYPYPLTGIVVGGKQLGRQIGFPTANLLTDHPSKLIPGDGVYVCMAAVDGEEATAVYPAMVNIGTRPTVDGVNHHRTVEAHLLDFQGDLYDSRITLTFFKRIRSEIRFSTVEQLRSRLEADRREVRFYFETHPFSEFRK